MQRDAELGVVELQVQRTGANGHCRHEDAYPPPLSLRWSNFSPFQNQGECITYVATAGKHA